MTEAQYRQGSQGSPQGYVRACAVSDLPPGDGAVGVEIGGEPVAIIRAEGEVYALRDVCSHAEVPLSEGEIYDHTVECWLHGSCFDLRTGEPTGPPATEPVPTYPVKIEGDDVLVAIEES
jgi:3-phenylpropionate/trans-cinnamate dioxygenase ferredoxin subunit